MNLRLIIAFLSLAALWYVATLATALFGFSISMDAFGRGARSPLGAALMNAHFVMGFPLTLIYIGSPRAIQISNGAVYLLFFANSAIWAALLIFGVCQWKKRNARTSQSS